MTDETGDSNTGSKSDTDINRKRRVTVGMRLMACSRKLVP